MRNEPDASHFSDSKHQATAKVVAVVHALGEPDFDPKTLQGIAKAAQLPRVVTWRILHTLLDAGWVKRIEDADLWQLDAGLLRYCHSFQRSIDARRSAIDEEVDRMTGRALK